MEYRDVLDIVKTGEGYTIEMKKSFNDSIGKEICAFANSSGGKIILGVDDKSGDVHGCRLSNQDRSRIQDIARNMNPSFNVQIEQVGDLAVVFVPEGKDKPYTVNGHFYLRFGANSQQLNRNEIRDLFQKENLISFERQTPDFNEKDFSVEKFNGFKAEAKLEKNLSKKHILENLNFFTDDRLNNCGVLFFSKNIKKYLPNAVVSCFLYSDKEHTDIIDSKEYAEDFLSNLNNAYNYLISKLNTSIIFDGGLKRKERLELPGEALREAIINAMIHRDYFYPAQVQIHISKDRLEITNPGQLLFPKKELGKRSAHRNPVLVDIAHRLGLAEKAGSGIKRIRKMISDNKTGISFEAESFFTITFYRVDANVYTNVDAKSQNRHKTAADVNANVYANPTQVRRKWIIDYLEKNKKITAAAICEKFKISKVSVSRDIRKLIADDKIVKKGGGNNVWYELKKQEVL
jgi:ATP-dependent DNA helicase RecG